MLTRLLELLAPGRHSCRSCRPCTAFLSGDKEAYRTAAAAASCHQLLSTHDRYTRNSYQASSYIAVATRDNNSGSSLTTGESCT